MEYEIKIRGLGKLRSLNSALKLDLDPTITIKSLFGKLKSIVNELNNVLTSKNDPLMGVLILVNEVDYRLINNREIRDVVEGNTITITIIPVSHGG